MAKNQIVNSAGSIFRCIPMKNGAPFGEHWVEVMKKDGSTVGVGRFNNSFSNLEEATLWVRQNLEAPEYW